MGARGTVLSERPAALCKWSLRFLDADQEHGYLLSQRDAQLRSSRLCLTAMSVLGALSAIVLVLVHEFLSDVRTKAAHDLTWARFWLTCSLCGLSTLLLGALTCETTARQFSERALEWMAITFVLLNISAVVATDNYYHARLRGYDPAEVWVAMAPCSNSFVLLSIVGFVTASHILLHARWCGLVCVEIFGVLLYLALGTGIGSPEGYGMWTNAWILFGITAIISLGKRRSEVQDRTAFIEIVGEKSLRCEAEFALERTLGKMTVKQENDGVVHGKAQSEASVPTTAATGRVFDALHAIDSAAATDNAFQGLIELGRREHWLVNPQDLSLRLKEVLGQGGFGIVVAGTLCGAEVAVKFTDEWHTPHENLDSLGHELRIIRQLRHPNIVLTYGAILDAQRHRLGLVLERLQGKTLADFVDGTTVPFSSGPHLGFITIGQISRDVCKALWYLHTRTPSIVHGDLKDESVFLEQCPVGVRVKLLDFGLARLLGQHRQPQGATISWAPPELLEKGCHPSTSADIYALGHLVFFMATRTRPFEQYPRSGIIRMLETKQIPNLDWPSTCLHKELYQPLVESCINVKESSRPAAHEVLEELNRWNEVEQATSSHTLHL